MRRLGTVIANIYTIEFQKRGLPHVHMMVTLDEKDRPSTAEKIDLLVCAEIPDPIDLPQLHATISNFKLHGPCQNQPCWNGTMCKSVFPKPFTPRTVVVDGSYPTNYRRRDDGREIKKFTTTFSNANVVP
jgi:hypothetical protein